MPEVLFIGGPWDRTVRQVNNSGDLVAICDGKEILYKSSHHGMPSGLSYLVALSPDSVIEDTPDAIRDTGHKPFVKS